MSLIYFLRNEKEFSVNLKSDTAIYLLYVYAINPNRVSLCTQMTTLLVVKLYSIILELKGKIKEKQETKIKGKMCFQENNFPQLFKAWLSLILSFKV